MSSETKLKMLEEDVKEFKDNFKIITQEIVEIGKTLVKLNINYDNQYKYAHDELHDTHNQLQEINIRLGLLERSTEMLEKKKREDEENSKKIKNRFGNIIERLIYFAITLIIGGIATFDIFFKK